MLAIAFFITAILYASVGFGGGSTYNALLVLGGTDFRLVPIVALCCNLTVVFGGTIAFLRAGLLRMEVVLPFTLASVPMAWLGGATPIDRSSFLLVLGVSLVATAVILLIPRPEATVVSPRWARAQLWGLGVPLGGALGFLAGLVGIGGGIFLSPLLHLGRVAAPRVIAATASFFILVNSAAGLLGQTMKGACALQIQSFTPFLLPWLAVVVGGLVGNHAGLHIFREITVRRLTAILVLYVGIRLIYAWILGD